MNTRTQGSTACTNNGVYKTKETDKKLGVYIYAVYVSKQTDRYVRKWVDMFLS